MAQDIRWRKVTPPVYHHQIQFVNKRIAEILHGIMVCATGETSASPAWTRPTCIPQPHLERVEIPFPTGAEDGATRWGRQQICKTVKGKQTSVRRIPLTGSVVAWYGSLVVHDAQLLQGAQVGLSRGGTQNFIGQCAFSFLYDGFAVANGVYHILEGLR